MKRVGHLFESILDRNNLLTATWKAARGKRRRPEVADYLAHLDRRLAELAAGLRDGTYPVGRFRQFVLRDPKERIITAPCFAERVLHHAVMNVCEPHFERWLIADTFACRAGKGRSAALDRAGAFARSHGWFLSMDVRAYFDSVSHEVLNEALARRFKDARLLALFGRVIAAYRGAAGRGLPIGSLCSQHLANFYLDRFDRFVKETLRRRGYVRYMDDVVVWGDDHRDLAEVRSRCEAFLAEALRLTPKPTPFVNRTAHGMDFLGARQYPTHRTLNRRSRLRFRRKLRRLAGAEAAGSLSEPGLQQRGTALVAFAAGAGVSSWHFRRRELSSLAVSGPTARSA